MFIDIGYKDHLVLPDVKTPAILFLTLVLVLLSITQNTCGTR